MATAGDSALEVAGDFDEHFDDERDESLWTSILSQMQSSSGSKLPWRKNLICLGDNLVGKTTLVAKLQGNDEPIKGSGLEYFYLNIKDDYKEEHAKLGVWVVDGDTSHSGLLRHALTAESFEHSLAVISVSMAQPWVALKSLETWAAVLKNHVGRLPLTGEQLKEHKESLIRSYKDYVDPESQSAHPAAHRKSINPLHPSTFSSESESEGAEHLLELPYNVLSHNLGIPIVVVVTKSDAISELEKDQDYKEEHFDYIQQRIRRFCLNYGAALFYTSVKEGRNCELLYKYIVHRIYGFQFSSPASVVDRESIFVPAGWDTDKKIDILNDNIVSLSPDAAFEDVIVEPSQPQSARRDMEVYADSEQDFLLKQQILLQKNAAAGGGSPSSSARTESPKRSIAGTPTTGGAARSAGSPFPSTPSPRKMAQGMEAKAGTAGEAVLANFFNNLLTKKPGATPPPKADGSFTQGDTNRTPKKS